MTYGEYPPGGPQQPETPPPGYPYAPAPVDPYAQPYPGAQQQPYPGAYPPPAGGYPPSGAYPPLGAYPPPGAYPPGAYPSSGAYPPPSGAYPPPSGAYPPPSGAYPPPQPGSPLPYPPEQTNTLATLSIVFAFVFAPVGALLGHLALGQIKQSHERGRERALIGMTLSYAVIVFAVLALVATLTVADRSGDGTTTVAGDEPSLTMPAPAAPPGTTAPKQSRVDISNVLLSLDEVRTIMKTPGLSPSSSSGSGSGSGSDKDVTAEPEECLSAVAAGIDTVYEGKGGRDYKRASFSDNSVVTIVDQVAVGFDDAAAARKFVADSRTQWQQCAGRSFTLTSPSGTITWDIGTPTGGPERVAVRSTITAGPGVPQYRVLAVKGSVVVDIAVVSPTATTEPDVITDRILARIPS